MLERCCSAKIKYKHLLKHETKRHALMRFLLLILIIFFYFLFISQKYGVQQGIMVTVLTWSFFVLSTPIADAGFLIDFPVRLVMRVRMFFSEILVWGIAIFLNLYVFFYDPSLYSKTKILVFFKEILDNPFPFWLIFFISMAGTFLSIRFGDELLDKVRHKDRVLYKKHKNKHKLIVMSFFFLITLVLYNFLLKKLGVSLPL